MRLTPTISIVIPTYNRCIFLSATLDSISSIYSGQSIEVLVIDNGSTDNTKYVVEHFALRVSFQCRYVYEACAGLHVGRNLGAQLAQGDIIAYLDDDVLVQQGWIDAILERFSSDLQLALLGGPCRPLWEGGEPPPWVELFRFSKGEGWILGSLSLMDLGSAAHVTSGANVFGCNFCIRRQVIFEYGGFHPDGMPAHLLKYRGDGETALALAIGENPAYTILYDPRVAVVHRVPAIRMTLNYFMQIAKRNAFGFAYTFYRNNAPMSLFQASKLALRLSKNFVAASIRYVMKYLFLYIKSDKNTLIPLRYALVIHFWSLFHFVRICLTPKLQAWVLQRSYMRGDPCPYQTL